MANLPDDPDKISKRFARVPPLTKCSREAWTKFAQSLLPVLSIYSDKVAKIFAAEFEYFEEEAITLRSVLEATAAVNETILINDQPITLAPRYIVILSQLLQDKFADVPQAMDLARQHAGQPLYWYHRVYRLCVGSDTTERRWLMGRLIKLLSSAPKVSPSALGSHAQTIKQVLGPLHANFDRTDWTMDSAVLEAALFAAHDHFPAFAIASKVDINNDYDALEESLCDFPEWVRMQPGAHTAAASTPAPSHGAPAQALAASIKDGKAGDGSVSCGFCGRDKHASKDCRTMQAMRRLASKSPDKLLHILPPGSSLTVLGNQYRSSAYSGSVRTLAACSTTVSPSSTITTTTTFKLPLCSDISAAQLPSQPSSSPSNHGDSATTVQFYCDSAADLHMTSHEEWFSELAPIDPVPLDFGSSRLAATAIGTIFVDVSVPAGGEDDAVQSSSLVRIKLTDVLFVPDMPADKSLLAILAVTKAGKSPPGSIQLRETDSSLTVDGLDVPLDVQPVELDQATTRRLFLSGRIHHSRQGQNHLPAAATAASTGGASPLFNPSEEKTLTEMAPEQTSVMQKSPQQPQQPQQPQPQALASQVKNLSVTEQQLHRALGHRHSAVAAAELLENIDLIKATKEQRQQLCDCDTCMMTKGKLQPHPKAARRPATAVNARWSVDNTPMPVTSIDGHTNILSLSDERSCYIVKAVATKSRDASELTEHISSAIEMSGPPKAMRSDNEFSQANAYRKLLRKHRVRLESTSPYSPEQNGSAEQRQTAISRMIRSWMHESQMPKSYWHLAVDCATERLNMTLVQKNTGETVQPFSAFHGGSKPVLLFPEGWGALCYVTLRPAERQGKLGPTSVKAAFLGRAPGTAAALVVLADGTLRVTTDIVFPKTYQPGGVLFKDTSASLEGQQAVMDAETVPSPSDPEWTPPAAGTSSASASPGHPDQQTTPLPRPSLAPAHSSTMDVRADDDEDLLSGEGQQPQQLGGTGGPSQDGTTTTAAQENAEFSYSEARGSHAPQTQVAVTRSGRAVRTPSNFFEAVPSAGSHPHALVAGQRAVSFHNRSALNRPDEQAQRPAEPVYYFVESPGSFADVLKCQQPERYFQALHDEWEGLIANKVFQAVDLPKDADTLPLFSFFTDKVNADNEWVKSKCRTVARGDLQDWWQYFNTTASVLSIQHFRLFIALCASQKLTPWSIDVTQAFLHVDLEEEIYVRLTRDVLDHIPNALAGQLQTIRKNGGRPGLKLLKTLYGLKQGPHNWGHHLEKTLASYGLRQMVKSQCLWTLHDSAGQLLLIVCVYVDDIGFASPVAAERQRFVRFLETQYKIGAPEEMTSYIGIKVVRDATSGDIHLSQPGHIRAGLDRFNMVNCKPAITPMVPHTMHDLRQFSPKEGSDEANDMKAIPYPQLVGLLNYLSVTTRPDIAIATRQLAKFMHSPGLAHWKMAKRVLAYLSGTATLGLHFQGGAAPQLYGHCDSSHAEDKDHSLSTSGYLTMMAGAPINWGVKLHEAVAISTGESEFYGLYYLALDVLGYRELLRELGLGQTAPTPVDCDNQAAIAWAHGKGRLTSLKHVRLKYHLVQQVVRDAELEVHYLETKRMPADFLTKVLNRELFEVCRDSVMALPDRRTSQLPVQGGVKTSKELTGTQKSNQLSASAPAQRRSSSSSSLSKTALAAW